MIAVSSLLFSVPALSMERQFLWFYFCAFFFIGFVLFSVQKEKILPAAFLILPLAVTVSSRDRILIQNVLYAMVCFGILYYAGRNRYAVWLMRIAAAVLWGIWLWHGDIPRAVAVSLIVLMAASLAGWKKWEVRYMAFLLILAAVAAAIFPSHNGPMRWKRVRRMADKVYSYISSLGRRSAEEWEDLVGDEETAYMGYSETGQLSGGGSENDSISLYYITDDHSNRVYLRGAVFAEMGRNGFAEKMAEDLPANAWLAKYLSDLAVTGISREEALCFSKWDYAKVTYENMKTHDLLCPAGVVFTTGSEEGEMKGKGYAYEVSYIQFDYASPYFRRFAEAAAEAEVADYEDAAEAARKIYYLDLDRYMSREEYEEYITALRESGEEDSYLDCSMATDRVTSLAEELGDGCETDWEKARQIEAFLRQYSYDAGTDLRGRENYVDAFLFEEQKGYCVHYASAMVLLLRLNGIPARYVQGFLFRPDDSGEVSGSHAHAWVEAYMSGVGWVTFEPTASEANAEDRAWNKQPAGEKQPEEELFPEEPEITPPDLPVGELPAVSVRTDHSRGMKSMLRTIIWYVLIGLLGLFMAILLFLFAGRLRYKHLPPEEKLKTDMETVRKEIIRRYPRAAEDAPSGSVLDYVQYVEDEKLQKDLMVLIGGYYRVRFRKDPPEPKLVENVRKMAVRLKHSPKTV